MKRKRATVQDYNILGVHFYKVGAFDHAIAQLEMAAALAPDVSSLHYNLGGAYYSKGRVADAECEFRHALDLDPSHVRARWFRGLCLEKLDRLEEALAEFQWVLGHSTGTREAESAREEIEAISLMRSGRGNEGSRR